MPLEVFHMGNVEPSLTYWCAQELFTSADGSAASANSASAASAVRLEALVEEML